MPSLFNKIGLLCWGKQQTTQKLQRRTSLIWQTLGLLVLLLSSNGSYAADAQYLFGTLPSNDAKDRDIFVSSLNGFNTFTGTDISQTKNGVTITGKIDNSTALFSTNRGVVTAVRVQASDLKSCDSGAKKIDTDTNRGVVDLVAATQAGPDRQFPKSYCVSVDYNGKITTFGPYAIYYRLNLPSNFNYTQNSTSDFKFTWYSVSGANTYRVLVTEGRNLENLPDYDAPTPTCLSSPCLGTYTTSSTSYSYQKSLTAGKKYCAYVRAGTTENSSIRIHRSGWQEKCFIVSAPAVNSGLPDLIVESSSLKLPSGATVNVGKSFTVEAKVTNQGVKSSEKTVLKYFLSSDSIISVEDEWMGSLQIPPLDSSKTTDVLTKSIATDKTGTFYVGACVVAYSDNVLNESNSSNNCSEAVQLEISTVNLEISPNPAEIDFGKVELYNGKVETFTLTNNSDREIVVQPWNSPSGFDAGVKPPCQGTFIRIPSNSSCEIEVVFRPSSVEPYREEIKIFSDANNSPISLTLLGEGFQDKRAVLYTHHTELNFDNVPLGTQKELVFWMSNNGNADATVANIVPQLPVGFALKNTLSDTCGPTIDIWRTCQITVIFSPTEERDYSGDLNISDDNNELVVKMSGKGIIRPQLIVTPSANGKIVVSTDNTTVLTCQPDSTPDACTTPLYDKGRTVTLTASQIGDYEFNGWTGDCETADSTSSIEVVLDDKKNCGALFVKKPILTIDVDGVTTQKPYAKGEPINLGMPQKGGHKFTGWEQPECEGLTVMPEGNITCTAVFIPQVQLTLIQPANGKIVVSTDNTTVLTCQPDSDPSACTGTYDKGIVVTLNATPSGDYEFVNWTGDCVGETSQQIFIQLDKSKTCGASFKRSQVQLTLLQPSSGGKIVVTKSGDPTPILTCASNSNPKDCIGSYDSGTTVTLTAIPDEPTTTDGKDGFVFYKWTGVCPGSTSPIDISLTAGTTCGALFTLSLYKNGNYVCVNGLSQEKDFSWLLRNDIIPANTKQGNSKTPPVGASPSDIAPYLVTEMKISSRVNDECFRIPNNTTLFVSYPDSPFDTTEMCEVKAAPNVCKFNPTIRLVTEAQMLTTIRGFVWNDTDESGLQEAGESYLPIWAVLLKRPDGSEISTFTDVNGYYEFTGLSTGNYTVFAETRTGAIYTTSETETVKIDSTNIPMAVSFGIKIVTPPGTAQLQVIPSDNGIVSGGIGSGMLYCGYGDNVLGPDCFVNFSTTSVPFGVVKAVPKAGYSFVAWSDPSICPNATAELCNPVLSGGKNLSLSASFKANGEPTIDPNVTIGGNITTTPTISNVRLSSSIFEPGKQVEISWNSTDQTKYVVYLYDDSTNSLVSDVTCPSNSFHPTLGSACLLYETSSNSSVKWTVPWVLSAGHYTLKVAVGNGNNWSDAIVATTPQEALTYLEIVPPTNGIISGYIGSSTIYCGNGDNNVIGDKCTAPGFSANTMRILTANPKQGYTFSQWSNASVCLFVTDTSCLPMTTGNASAKLTAEFKPTGVTVGGTVPANSIGANLWIDVNLNGISDAGDFYSYDPEWGGIDITLKNLDSGKEYSGFVGPVEYRNEYDSYYQIVMWQCCEESIPTGRYKVVLGLPNGWEQVIPSPESLNEVNITQEGLSLKIGIRPPSIVNVFGVNNVEATGMCRHPGEYINLNPSGKESLIRYGINSIANNDIHTFQTLGFNGKAQVVNGKPIVTITPSDPSFAHLNPTNEVKNVALSENTISFDIPIVFNEASYSNANDPTMGDMSIELSVTDNNNRTFRSAVCALVPNTTAVVDAGPDITARVGELVQFKATVTDPDVNQRHDGMWDFEGDEVKGTLATTHTFTEPGVYRVYFFADSQRDSGNPDPYLESDFVTVTVEEALPVALLTTIPPAVCSGDTFDVTIRAEKTDTQPVDGIEMVLAFDPNQLKVNSVTNNSSNGFDLELDNMVDSTAGKINFSAIAVDNPVKTQSFDIFTVSLTAVGKEKTATLDLLNGSKLTNSGETVAASLVDTHLTFADCLDYQVNLQQAKARGSWVNTGLAVSLGSVSVAKGYSNTTNASGEGKLVVETAPAENDYFCVKNSHTLANKIAQPFPKVGTRVDFGTLWEGDAKEDNQLDTNDASFIASKAKCYTACVSNLPSSCTAKDFQQTDLNADGCVNLDDVKLFQSNFKTPKKVSQCELQATSLYRKGERGTREGDRQALTLGVNVSKDLTVGSSFDYTVKVNANESQSTNAAEIYLNFDPTQLQVNRITAGNSFDFILDNAVDNVKGEINFAALVLENALPTQSVDLATVSFTLLKAGGEQTIVFNSSAGRETKVANDGESVMAIGEDGQIVVENSVAQLPITDGDYQLFGTARDKSGKPQVAVTMQVNDRTTITDATGKWEMSGLPEGDYVVKGTAGNFLCLTNISVGNQQYRQEAACKQQSSLNVTAKSIPERPIYQGENLSYAIIVTNESTQTAQNVVLNLAFPQGAKLVGLTAEDGECDLATARCTWSSLSAGSGANIEAMFSELSVGFFVNMAVNADSFPTDGITKRKTVKPYLSTSITCTPKEVFMLSKLHCSITAELSAFALESTATGVQLRFTPSKGTEVTSVSAANYGQCSVEDGAVVCTLNDLSVQNATQVSRAKIEVDLKLIDSGLLIMTSESKLTATNYPEHRAITYSSIVIPKDFKVGLVLMTDTTQSMNPHIEAVIKAFENISKDALLGSASLPNTVLLEFKDEVRSAIRPTQDINVVLTALRGLKVGGGGTCPEASAEAFHIGADLVADNGILVLVTNAPPRPETDIDALKKRLTELYDRGVKVYLFYKPECDVKSNAEQGGFEGLDISTFPITP